MLLLVYLHLWQRRVLLLPFPPLAWSLAALQTLQEQDCRLLHWVSTKMSFIIKLFISSFAYWARRNLYVGVDNTQSDAKLMLNNLTEFISCKTLGSSATIC